MTTAAMIREKSMKGTVIEIQRWSVSDGPGARTIVFLKGCPLHCPWCANPESQAPNAQIGIYKSRCVSCGACTRECPEGIAIPAREGAFASQGCTGCGTCVDFCHADARSWMGETLSVEQIMDTIKKDRVFYRNSFGGVTFSGGEPFTQPGFLKELILSCQDLGIHTAVETCGHFSWDKASGAVKALDFILFDLKHMDPAVHKRLTGVTNGVILKNAQHCAALNTPMVIRIPVIPTVNDSHENIKATAGFVKRHLPGVRGIEILPYHKLGLVKYSALGLDYTLDHIKSPSHAHMTRLKQIIINEGVACITEDTGYDTLI